MGRSSASFNKKELEKKRAQKKKEKQKRKEERKANSGGNSLDDMIAYVDENGVITSEAPDPDKKEEIDASEILVSTPKKGEEEEEILQGRVEHFNADKGYGFIKDLSNGEKYFFHISEAFPNITEGNKVTFDLEKGTRGLNAVKIQAVE
ncbi:cold-shock protein [Maribellus mangrovi]|uniref:cold-shock protein n=1 Tax=Maribellus mangrovi TaxID=3133146 RepID=UPI0030EEE211